MHPKYSQTKHLKNKARTCCLRLRTCYDYGCDQSSMRWCTCHIIRRSMRRYTRDKHTRSCIHQLHVYQQRIPTCIVYSHLHACIKAMIVHSSFTYYIERLKSAVRHSSMRWCTCHNIQQSMRRYIHNKHARSCVHRLHVHRLWNMCSFLIFLYYRCDTTKVKLHSPCSTSALQTWCVRV